MYRGADTLIIKIVKKKLDLVKKKLCKAELGVCPPFHTFIYTHTCACIHMYVHTTCKITHITHIYKHASIHL